MPGITMKALRVLLPVIIIVLTYPIGCGEGECLKYIHDKYIGVSFCMRSTVYQSNLQNIFQWKL